MKRFSVLIFLIGVVLVGASNQVYSTGEKSSKVKKSSRSGAKGLLGYWKFDEGNGKIAKDSSGNGYDGRINGAEYVKVKSGYCLKFNGKNNFVRVAFPMNYKLLEGSFEAWAAPNLNPKGKRGTGRIITTDSVMFHIEGKKWGLLVYDGINISTLDGPEAEDDKWTHFAVTWSGFYARFYVNGKEITTPLGPLKYIGRLGTNYNGDVDCYIGSRPTGALSFNGLIDEVKFYNYALDACKIKEHYEQEQKNR